MSAVNAASQLENAARNAWVATSNPEAKATKLREILRALRHYVHRLDGVGESDPWNVHSIVRAKKYLLLLGDDLEELAASCEAEKKQPA